jgi:hypothetical protein
MQAAFPEQGVLPSPADTVSSIAFDLAGARMLAASWDGSVHAYTTSQTPTVRVLHSYQPAGAGKEALLDVSFHEVRSWEHWGASLATCC